MGRDSRKERSMKEDFGGVVFIHSHRGKPLYIEFLSFSGREVDISFIRYMAENSEPAVLAFFSMLKLETVYQVVGRYWFEDNSFMLEITGYVERCPPDFSEEEGEYPCVCGPHNGDGSLCENCGGTRIPF